MKKCTWKRFAASVLMAAMIAGQTNAAFADETTDIQVNTIEDAAEVLAETHLQTEIPAETEAAAVETEAPVIETEVPVVETEAPVVETETQTETTKESETETVRESETQKETETVKESETQKETETVKESEVKVPETKPAETKVPETQSAETKAPEEKPAETKAPETQPAETKAPETQAQTAAQSVGYEPSALFSKIGDRVQYNVDVPIEGLPSFITQEMIVGALKAQDEKGYPASVTIAQIIQESGFGSYGPGGDQGRGLSGLAFQYCNLFGIKGTGTNGSAYLSTSEMNPDGSVYHIKAAFRAYRTYSEAIEDRTNLIANHYSDLINGVTDANTFAVRIGGRWATDLNYGTSLIHLMQLYDLYRLDNMTLKDFSQMIGRFADPCPGSVVTSNFGYRDFDHKFHKGLDLGTGGNIPTYAAESGTVIHVGFAGSAGNMITIDHGDGLVTKYMHHAQMYVNVGDHVEKGQQIGLSGSTGNSTGNHLHFQVEENGVAVNPLLYLQGDGTTQGMERKSPLDHFIDRKAAFSKEDEIEVAN